MIFISEMVVMYITRKKHVQFTWEKLLKGNALAPSRRLTTSPVLLSQARTKSLYGQEDLIKGINKFGV